MYTKEFKRDNHSNAILAVDHSAKEKLKKQRAMHRTLEEQTLIINKLENEMKTLRNFVYSMIEDNTEKK